MEISIYKETGQLFYALAEYIQKSAEKAMARRNQFNFVLAGGNSPKKLYKLLASEDFRNKINWDKTFFFFGDERFVPENHSQRNSKMAKENLLNPLKIPRSRIYEVDTSGTPEEAAGQYMKTISGHFRNKPVRFDCILLGLGKDAHTASLFPGSPVLEETEATVRPVFLKGKIPRITMTFPLISQARQIVFLVFGREKADAVLHVLENNTETSGTAFPARLISGDKNVKWFLDREAASKL